MKRPVPASVVINNYNYGAFVRDAIESALAQTYPLTEVVVVDDGSTDDSRSIIADYDDRLIPVLKENGGQASALNAGFAASRGEVVLFLDADDMLLPTAVEQAVRLFDQPDVVKVHWPLWNIDRDGNTTGEMTPEGILPEGDLRQVVLDNGPASHVNPPTSGNAWSRAFLQRILPMPEGPFRTWADVYLLELAPLFGSMKRIPEPQGSYRLHGSNHYAGRSFEENLKRGVRVYDHLCEAMSRYCDELGVSLSAETCRRNSWFHRIQQSLREILALVPSGSSFILVDEDEWGTDEVVEGRQRIPFLEREGKYWGPPPDDETAIRELDRLRQTGVQSMVFAWPAFWWLDHYTRLHDRLRSAFRCSLRNDRIAVFDLRSARC